MATDQIEDVLADLHAAVNTMPEAERAYSMRFLSKNADLSPEDFLAKFTADRADRAEAAAIQAHRDEKVLQDAKELVSRLGTDVLLAGIASDSDSGNLVAQPETEAKL